MWPESSVMLRWAVSITASRSFSACSDWLVRSAVSLMPWPRRKLTWSRRSSSVRARLRVVARRLVGEGAQVPGKLGQPELELAVAPHCFEGFAAPGAAGAPRQDDGGEQQRQHEAARAPAPHAGGDGVAARREQDRVQVHRGKLADLPPAIKT